MTSPADLFPYPDLTTLPTDRKPTLQDVRLLKKQINANAMAVTSARGGGAHGHLALVKTPAQYLQIAGAAWTDPVHPGAAPNIPAGATGPQITEINRQFKADLDEFMQYKATQAALRNCLTTAIPSTYIDILADEEFEYANVTPSAIITHMNDNYGEVTADDLTDNIKDLQAQWSPSQPLEDLWKQVRRCQAFALAHDPITDMTAMREIMTNLENSGVFTEALKDWRAKSEADKTLPNMRTHFNKADKERLRAMTTKEAGYANAIIDTTSGKENKAPDLSSTGPHGLYYCWTHGLTKNSKHTSQTCSNKSHGHQTNATIYNMLGGNNRIQRAKNERPIYKPPQRPANVVAAYNATTTQVTSEAP
jgi:hypothetical protein